MDWRLPVLHHLLLYHCIFVRIAKIKKTDIPKIGENVESTWSSHTLLVARGGYNYIGKVFSSFLRS